MARSGKAEERSKRRNVKTSKRRNNKKAKAVLGQSWIHLVNSW
jgi:hypothetical protein